MLFFRLFALGLVVELVSVTLWMIFVFDKVQASTVSKALVASGISAAFSLFVMVIVGLLIKLELCSFQPILSDDDVAASAEKANGSV